MGFDHNCDNKISRQELVDYAAHDMPQADINHAELMEMFEAADTNDDNFVEYEEFLNAGKQYEGDGDEMEDAEPIDFIRMKERNLLHPKLTKKKLSFHGIRMPRRRHH